MNTIDGPTKLVRQDAILGGLSIGQLSDMSVVWHISLPLINSFNKTDAAIFPYRLWFLKGFFFVSLIQSNKEKLFGR